MVESERERLELQEHFEQLQNEAEDACNGLESALKENVLIREQSAEQLESVKRQVSRQRLLHEQSDSKATALTEAIQDKMEEITALQHAVEGLELENLELRTDGLHQQTLVARLKEEVWSIVTY